MITDTVHTAAHEERRDHAAAKVCSRALPRATNLLLGAHEALASCEWGEWDTLTDRNRPHHAANRNEVQKQTVQNEFPKLDAGTISIAATHR